MSAVRSVPGVLGGIQEPWAPSVIAEANGFQLKAVRLAGEFPWHTHEREDELFYCVEGEFRIELRDTEAVRLSAGDVYVVPAGQEHRPVAERAAAALVMERAETRQYGDAA